MTDDCDIVSGCATQSATISSLLLHVRDHGTFWHCAEWEDVSNSQVCVLASVDELTGVHALVCDECFCLVLELVWVAERDLDEWCATTWIVDDVLHYTPDVSMLLGEVELSELCWGFVEALMGRYSILSVLIPVAQSGNVRTEDRATTLSLVANNSTHPAVLVSGLKWYILK